jgi:beta-glucanase (GH16 family)
MNHLDLTTAEKAGQGNPFHKPVYFILNQAIGGNCGGDPSQTEFPVRFEVDWVRVYQHNLERSITKRRLSTKRPAP